MFDLLLEQIMGHKRERTQADIYIHAKVKDIRVLEFDKIDSAYEQSKNASKELRKKLEEILPQNED